MIWKRVKFLLALMLASPLPGCGDAGPTIVPVQGKVFYNEAPLTNGTVMFQPPTGQPAVGEIQADGSFSLSTFSPDDGATVGLNKVRIASFKDDGISADQGEMMLGTLAIPNRYTSLAKSGLTADVKPDENEPFVFRLTGE